MIVYNVLDPDVECSIICAVHILTQLQVEEHADFRVVDTAIFLVKYHSIMHDAPAYVEDDNWLKIPNEFEPGEHVVKKIVVFCVKEEYAHAVAMVGYAPSLRA